MIILNGFNFIKVNKNIQKKIYNGENGRTLGVLNRKGQEIRFMSEDIIFRNIEKSDTEALWNMMNQLDYETKFMLYEPGERAKNLDRLQGIVDNAVDGDDLFFLEIGRAHV